MSDTTREAFFAVCQDAEPAGDFYVSLYRRETYFGGPEEGGWYGHDNTLVAAKWYPTESAARAVEEQVEAHAKQLTKEAHDAFNRQCAAELEWVERRDPMADASDYFSEPGGPDEYYVRVEEKQGYFASQGSRHYE